MMHHIGQHILYMIKLRFTIILQVTDPLDDGPVLLCVPVHGHTVHHTDTFDNPVRNPWSTIVSSTRILGRSYEYYFSAAPSDLTGPSIENATSLLPGTITPAVMSSRSGRWVTENVRPLSRLVRTTPSRPTAVMPPS